MVSKQVKTFGDRLHEYQVSNELQTVDIARRFSVDPNFVRLLIRGLRYPGKALLRDFCEAFQEPADKWIDILRWERESDPEVKAMLASKLVREWGPVDDSESEGLPETVLHEPETGRPLPVMTWSAFADSAYNRESNGESPNFWLRIDGDSPCAGIATGNTLLLSRVAVFELAEEEDCLALVCRCADSPTIGRMTRKGDEVRIDGGGALKTFPIRGAESEAAFYRVRCVIRYD